MPATGFSVDSDVEALLGRFPEALKKVNAELLAAERRAASLIKNGKDIPLDELQRIDRLKANQATYAEKVAQQKAIKEQANKVIREIMGNPTGSGSTNAVMATAGGGLRVFAQLNVDEALELKEIAKKSKADKPFAQKFADLINFHNPHGAARTWLRGDPGTGSIGTMLRKLGGKQLAGQTDDEFKANIGAAAGRIFIAAKVAGAFADQAISKAKDRETAEKIKKQLADERWKRAREYRFSSPEQGQLDERDLAQKVADGRPVGPLQQALATLGLKPAADFIDTHRNSTSALQSLVDYRRRLFEKDFGRDTADALFMKATTDPEVDRKIREKAWEGGLMGFLHHQLGYVTGSAQRERQKMVLERQEELMSNQYSEREKAAQRYYETDPNRIVARADNDRRLAAVNQRNLERISDWNQW